MRRIVFLLFVVTLSIWSGAAAPVSAQGDSITRTLALPITPSPSGPLAGIDPAGQTVIYWHQHSGDRAKALDAMAAEFNAANPWGITVQPSSQGSYGDVYRKMLAAITSGELPNLVVAFQGQAATYQLDGALVDLEQFVSDPQWGYTAAELADFFPRFIDHDVSPQFGMRLGFPLSRSMEMLYVNLDGLAELGYAAPPVSWQEFGEMACAWSRSAEGRVGFSLPADESFLAATIFGLGGDVFDYAADEYCYDGPQALYVLDVLQDLLARDCVNRVAEAGSDRVDFARRVNLFYFASSAAMPFVEAAIAEAEGGDFQWTVAALPYADLGAASPTQKLNGASVSIPVTTPEAELAAWLFVRWLAEPEQQAAWARITNFFPVRRSALALLQDDLAENPRYAAAVALLGATRMVPPLAGYDAVRDIILQEGILPIFDGARVESALHAANEHANLLYHTEFAP